MRERKLEDLHMTWPEIFKITFPNYVQLFEQLEHEWARTPSWRMIRCMRILNRMHRLNKQYLRWMDRYLKLEGAPPQPGSLQEAAHKELDAWLTDSRPVLFHDQDVIDLGLRLKRALEAAKGGRR